ncbi:flagellar basal-body rod protein FlgF [Lichenibacterium dinghuense]|uniref:flagellar basal-body rod protein FlgF n=1 Tax=Lichenibacterium dinghuense TaxID=2895977 RepID=UPI001F3E005A|nr:flagellar basal-body rod protein FlgF [Lichenibacterium sp. 6Y81]
MQSSFYVGLSGQMTVERRLTTIAQNVANMNTAGYKAEGVTFDTVLSRTGETPVAFSANGADYIDRAGGDRTKTDNPLDVAVQGDAWFGVKTAAGTVYTHDGRMQMSPTGQLLTVNGDAVLDAGGSGLILDPSAGPPTIAADGMITQNGAQVGAIGLFAIDPAAKLTRAQGSAVIPDRAATPVLDFTSTGVIQGFVEGSNVNPVLEITKLIAVQHNLDGVTQANTTADSTLQEAIKALGTGS